MEKEEEKLVRLLAERGLTVSAAESCTGGMVAQRVTSVPGASKVLRFSAVTYCDEAKEKILGVRGETLREYGAVSAETAREMASGVRKIWARTSASPSRASRGRRAARGNPWGSSTSARTPAGAA